MAAQPPTEGPQTAEEIAAAIRSQADAGDSGRSSAEDAAQLGAEQEASRAARKMLPDWMLEKKPAEVARRMPPGRVPKKRMPAEPQWSSPLVI